ncbi:MAG: class I SAM-dependent methyltransferase [Candidatus Anstonellales archaeon]
MRILNAGCGSDLSYGTDFVDLYPSSEKVIKVDLDNDRFPYPDETFDEVYSKCVFEHLTNPANFMKESYRVLKKGGRLVIITDNATFIGWWITSHKYEQRHGQEDMHFALFTHYHLENWAKKFSFKVKKVEYVSYINNNNLNLISLLKIAAKKLAYLVLPKKISCTRIKLEAIKF